MKQDYATDLTANLSELLVRLDALLSLRVLQSGLMGGA